jgi:uncharacterized protein involved in type VI secretion and phage assembly
MSMSMDESISVSRDESCRERYYGKYRGTVVNNIDPEQRGRIQALVPDVSNVMLSSWAEPALPAGGPHTGMFTVPQLGAGVWIEFEQGDPDYPIWTGCYWGNALETPALAKLIPPGVSGMAFQSTLQNGIVISDVPGPTGGIMLKTNLGATINVDSSGITIQNGQGAGIIMKGPSISIFGSPVNINMGTMVIT